MAELTAMEAYQACLDDLNVSMARARQRSGRPLNTLTQIQRALREDRFLREDFLQLWQGRIDCGQLNSPLQTVIQRNDELFRKVS